jgi:hypothetical protein
VTVPPPPNPRKMRAEFIGEEILDQPNTWREGTYGAEMAQRSRLVAGR